MSKLVIQCSAVEETLFRLRKGGERGEERMLVWLGRNGAGGKRQVREIFEPDQICRKDQFYLPPESMSSLMAVLRSTRSRILAQIHTHPGAAFHSEADDAWAIIRHVGALSLVLPRFAAGTTVSSFLTDVMAYEFSSSGEWQHVNSSCVEIDG